MYTRTLLAQKMTRGREGAQERELAKFDEDRRARELELMPNPLHNNKKREHVRCMPGRRRDDTYTPYL